MFLTPNERSIKKLPVAAASLVATPLLLFLSTSNLLYLDNQDELGHQLGVLLPFLGLFLVTLVGQSQSGPRH